MRTIQQLMASYKKKKKERMELQTAYTDSSTVNASSATAITTFRMTKYAEEIWKAGEDFRYLQNVCEHNTDLIGTRDYAVRLFYTDSHLSITVTHSTEGAERTHTEMTNLDYVDATPTWKFGSIAISKEIASNARVDLISLAKYMMVQDCERRIEDAIDTEILTATTNITYGGDATGTSTLATGDVITTDVIADARKKLRDNNYQPKFLVIGTAQEGTLLKDSQFVNASEYGDREVILNGEIGRYIGMKVIVTTNVTTSTTWGSGSLSGNTCYAIGVNNLGSSPVNLVWKQKPTYSYEYLPKYLSHYIYSDASYTVQLTHEKAISLIRVSNA